LTFYRANKKMGNIEMPDFNRTEFKRLKNGDEKILEILNSVDNPIDELKKRVKKSIELKKSGDDSVSNFTEQSVQWIEHSMKELDKVMKLIGESTEYKLARWVIETSTREDSANKGTR
jgi:hypothetical protein